MKIVTLILQILLSITCLVNARKNILKAREVLEENAKKHRVEMLGHGEAYDEYEYDYDDDDYDDDDDDDDEWDEWDPWELDDDVLEKRLTKLVNRMDSNNNEKIEFMELCIWTFKSMHAMDAKETYEEDFEDFDMNDDGFVSWEEFLDEEYEMDDYDEEDDEDPEEDKLDPDEKTQDDNILLEQVDLDFNSNYNRVKARFDTADKNKDGKLDTKEFIAFKDPFDKESEKDAWTKNVMLIVDKNGDGKISRDEYDNDWKILPKGYLEVRKRLDNKKPINFNQHENQDYMKRLAEFVKDLDTDFNSFFDHDKNGFLEGAEITLWLSPENAELAWDETEELVDLCDENEDGVLDLDEIIDEMDAWIDSDALQQGHMLRDEL